MENGYEVCAAEKGEFHMVFSDVVLPGISGIELVEQLLKRKAELRVLFSSGYMDDKSRLSVIRERGFIFLQKPYTMAELLNSMKEVLQ